MGNVADAVAGARELDGAFQNPLGDGEEPLGIGIDDADGDRGGVVSDPAIADDADIHFHDVAISDRARTADAVDDLFIDANANVAGEFFVAEKRALHSRLGH